MIEAIAVIISLVSFILLFSINRAVTISARENRVSSFYLHQLAKDKGPFDLRPFSLSELKKLNDYRIITKEELKQETIRRKEGH